VTGGLDPINVRPAHTKFDTTVRYLAVGDAALGNETPDDLLQDLLKVQAHFPELNCVTDEDRFVADSPLEGAGFEPSVPRCERRFLSGNGNRRRGDKR
jgi:hypothetical protein